MVMAQHQAVSSPRPNLRERAARAKEAASDLAAAARAKDEARDRLRRVAMAEILLNRVGGLEPNRIEQVTFDRYGMPVVVADGITLKMLDAETLGVRVNCDAGCGRYHYEQIADLADLGARLDDGYPHCQRVFA